MESPIDSFVRDSFAESGGYSRREAEEFFPALGYVSDDHWAFPAPTHLPASAPQAPEATGPSPLLGSSRLDKLYELLFQRLERRLEALKAEQLVVSVLPKMPEGDVSAQIHVPSSVTQGYVSTLDVLDVLDVEAEGVVFGSVLVERKAGVGK